ncbi:MAG TPA: SdpI family protein [Bacillota bacterium]|nr:SdpI family protein [Bacillota bacterium]
MEQQINNSKKLDLINLIAGAIVLFSAGLSLWFYPRLPARVPSHWDAAGQVNGYTTPLLASLIWPGMLLAIFLLTWLLPKIDPKRANYRLMGKTYRVVRLYIMVCLAMVQFGSFQAAIGSGINMPGTVGLAVGLLLVVIGNYLGKVKHNYTFGLKTPWTLANEDVWYKTHRAMGPLWVICGLMVAGSGFVPAALRIPLFIVALGAMAGIPFVYSYWLYRRLEK